MDLFISLIIHELVSHLPRGYWHTYFNIFLRFQLYMFISSQAGNNVTSPQRGNNPRSAPRAVEPGSVLTPLQSGRRARHQVRSVPTPRIPQSHFQGDASLQVLPILLLLLLFATWCLLGNDVLMKSPIAKATKSDVLSAWCTDRVCSF